MNCSLSVNYRLHLINVIEVLALCARTGDELSRRARRTLSTRLIGGETAARHRPTRRAARQLGLENRL